jgi:hypothetical protein
MNVNIVLFNRGAGGNFLARVLTLDPKTVALGKENIDTAEQRCLKYCYNKITQPFNSPSHKGNGLSVWVDTELNDFYFPLTRGVEKLITLNQIVVEPVHPDHYKEKIKLFGKDDQIKLYYIDITECENWVHDQAVHKILITPENQKNQTTILKSIVSGQLAHPISLKNIIESELTFCAEYVKICKLMNLISYPELALKIYKSWQKTWKQCDK